MRYVHHTHCSKECGSYQIEIRQEGIVSKFFNWWVLFGEEIEAS